MSSTCVIQLFNRTFNVKCPPEELPHLQLAAEKLQARIQYSQDNNKRLDEFQHLLFAALHMTHQLVLCEGHQPKEDRVAVFMSKLEDKIHQAIHEFTQSTEEKA